MFLSIIFFLTFEIFAFYLKLFEICDDKSNCNKTLTIEIGPFRRWPRKKILLFFSENDLFSDAIEKIGGCWALHFPKARMKARNGPYMCQCNPESINISIINLG